MVAIFNSLSRNASGAPAFSVDSGALPVGVVYVNGLPVETSGLICAAVFTDVVLMQGGVPFDSDGRVCLDVGGALSHFSSGAMPLTVDNKIIVTGYEVAPSVYVHGVAMTGDGGTAVAQNANTIGAPVTIVNTNDGRGLPSTVAFSRASDGTFTNSELLLATAATDVARVQDYDPITGEPLGFLIEEQRTNGIRNPRCEGAVAGTPGTTPTGWFFAAGAELALETVGSGSESGVPYVDVRISGTVTAARDLDIQMGAISDITATDGQVFTYSNYFKVAAGSQTNIANIFRQVNTYTSASAYVGTPLISAQSISGTLTRTDETFTAVGGTVAFLAPFVKITTGTSGAVDITLRVGAPQVELGANATSVVLPPVSSPAASTRARDITTITDLTDINFSATEGSMVVEFICPELGTTRIPTVISINSGSTANRINIRVLDNESDNLQFVVTSGGVTQAAVTGPLPMVAGSTYRAAISWEENSFKLAVNGIGYIEDTLGTVPTGLTQLELGIEAGGSTTHLNSHIRQVIYFPTQLSQAALNSWSTL
jgi:hypothetical protein